MNKLVAKIVHLGKNNNLVLTYEDETNFAKYKTYESKCDVCGTIRHRTETYIVRSEDGKEIQVGTSCLDKVIDTGKLSQQETNVLSANKLDDLFFIKKGNSRYFDTRALIAFLLDYKGSLDILTYTDFAKASKEYYKEEKEYSDSVNKIIKYFETFKTTNNFRDMVCTLTKEEYVDIKHFNIVKYAVKIYHDYIHFVDVNKINSGLENENFIIKKIWLEREYVDRRFSYYGIKTRIFKILDNDNNIIELETSSKKDFVSYIDKEVKCKIKGQYKSRLGMVTRVTNLALA